MHMINLWKSLTWLYKCYICLVPSIGQESLLVQSHSESRKAPEEQPSGLAVRSRSSSHSRVQDSLLLPGPLSVGELSTLPLKPLIQESTLLSRNVEKSTNVLSQNTRVLTVNSPGCKWWPADDSPVTCSQVAGYLVSILSPLLSCHCNGNNDA